MADGLPSRVVESWSASQSDRGKSSRIGGLVLRWMLGHRSIEGLSGAETCTDPQGGYPSGCRLTNGGSGPKRVSGSSWMNSEIDENGKDMMVLDWFRPPESKNLRPVWWDYVERCSPLERSSRLPYMAAGLGLPFEVDGPSSGSVTDLEGRLP
jgi:hypothetical protein